LTSASNVPAITLDELLAWSRQSANFWKAFFEAQPALLQLSCSIDDSGVVQELVRHIWVAELRWAQRVAGLPVVPREDLPKGPFAVLFNLHERAAEIFQSLLDDPAWNWNEVSVMPYEWLPAELRKASRRKMTAHTLLHSQRHWAQLATLVRGAGYPSAFQGDLIFSPALK
jgi:uncharacterized damage-inducible protein DinB